MAETFDQTNCSTPKFILKKINYVMYCVDFANHDRFAMGKLSGSNRLTMHKPTSK